MDGAAAWAVFSAMLKSRIILLAMAFCALLTFGAAADDWVAQRLRGGVFAYDGKVWVQLGRGDVVPDDRVIRTQADGRVTFVRDTESIEVGPSSQIQIFDKSGRRYTTVRQFYGTVEIEAEVQNVQHFGVRTPYLAAVVKGTKFKVSSDGDSSAVAVRRGKVAVENFETNETVLLTAGQSIDSENFVTRGADGSPVLKGVTGVPETTFAGLGGNEPTVLEQMLNGGGEDGGVGLDLDLLLGGSGEDGANVDLLLGGAGGASISVLGESANVVDVGANVGGLSVGASVGNPSSGTIVDVGVGAGGGTALGASAGTGGVSVTTPVGTVNLSLGGLL